MVQKQNRFITASLVGFILAAGLSLPVLAHNGEDHSAVNSTTDSRESTQSSEAKAQAETRRAEILKKIEAKKKELAEKLQKNDAKRTALKERFQGRLDETKKKVCEKRIEGIKRIMNNSGKSGNQNLSYFDKALTRIQDFYTSKELTVSNYDDLVKAVTNKKAAAKTAIEAVKASTDFKCEADNPAGSVDMFNGKVRTMHQALKDYRTALKELLQAVKAAAEAKENE